MKKILKQILITLTVVVFTGCGTGEEGSSSGGNGKLIDIKDLLPEAAKNVLLKTMTRTEPDGSFSEAEYFYDDKNMSVRWTTSYNGSLTAEYTLEHEYNGDGLITKTTQIHDYINAGYKIKTIAKTTYKNKMLDTFNTKSETVGMNTEPTVSKIKVLKRKGSIITEYVDKQYNGDNLLLTREYKSKVDKLNIIRHDSTTTYSKHAKKFAGETHKTYITHEYDDTLNTIDPIIYGKGEKFYVNNLFKRLHTPSKTTYDNNIGTGVITNTFEFDSNGLMTKRIENGTVITYTYYR